MQKKSKIIKKSNLEFFVITGVSGAGKTQTLKSLEDLGFFCVDNLPPDLIPQFVDLIAKKSSKLTKIALGIDVRATFVSKNTNKFFENLTPKLNELKKKGIAYKMIFLDADSATLIKRFSETRRRHPLGKNLIAAIKKETKLLEPFKAYSDKIINTSNYTLNELKSMLISLLGIKTSGPIINIISFGYKYGLPIESDIILDVRFLPNPNYINSLKNLTGNDKAVKKYVIKFKIIHDFIKHVYNFFDFVLPHYLKEGKSYLTIGFGCTGGKHRSVVLSNLLAEHLKKKSFTVKQQYRDIHK